MPKRERKPDIDMGIGDFDRLDVGMLAKRRGNRKIGEIIEIYKWKGRLRCSIEYENAWTGKKGGGIGRFPCDEVGEVIEATRDPETKDMYFTMDYEGRGSDSYEGENLKSRRTLRIERYSRGLHERMRKMGISYDE